MSGLDPDVAVSERPDDVVPPLLWYERTGLPPGHTFIEAFANPERHEEPCRVYWGSHGCGRPHGHEGPHWCACCDCEDHPEPGCVAGPPYYGPETNFYGEDVDGWDAGVDMEIT